MIRTAALGVVVALLGWSAPALASAQPPPRVHATTLAGQALPSNPVLRARQRIRLTVTGFPAGSAVVAAVAGRRHRYAYRPDRHGVVRTVFTIPARLPRGSHALVFVAAPAARPGPSKSALVAPHRRPDRQSVVVTVPRLGTFPFRTGPGAHGTGGVGVGPPRSGSPVVSRTGTDLLALIRDGLALLAAGALVWAFGRRVTWAGDAGKA